MNEQTHAPLVAGQDHLSGMPAEILHEIFKHVLHAPSQHVLPNPLLHLSKEIGPHAAKLLLKNCTLQLECRHRTSHHFWATSLYRSSTMGGYLHTPGNPTIKGLYSRWSKFRELRQYAEMLEGVDSLYIRFNWMRGLAFTILFHTDQPPDITAHGWTNSSATFRPDLRHWKEPAVCSVAWVEFFIKDMRNQCHEYWVGTRIFPNRFAAVALMDEMSDRQPWLGYPVLLRSIDRSVAIPKILSLGEKQSLIDNFFSREWVRNRLSRKQREKSYEHEAGRFKDWIGEQMGEKAEDFKRLVQEQRSSTMLRIRARALRSHSV